MIVGWFTVAWYRALTGLAGRLRHPHAEVRLDACRRGVSLHYHSLGGDLSRSVAADAGAGGLLAATTHAGMDLWAWLDRDQLHLPLLINRFPTEELNRELYYWLAAFLALDRPLGGGQEMTAGVRHLLRGIATSSRVLGQYPTLGARYGRLCASELEQRESALPKLGRQSARPVHQLEAAFRHALGAARLPGDPWLCEAMETARNGVVPATPPRWRAEHVPFLPVLLWGRPGAEIPGLRVRWLKRRTRRRPRGWKKSLVAPRFDPRQGPERPSGAPAGGEHLYPEWDYQRRAYRRDWCRVTEKTPPGAKRTDRDPVLDALARRVRRQFEALRQVTVWNRYLESGDELDVDAFVDSVGDARRLGLRSSRLYRRREDRRRDLSVAVLVDVSRSTAAWVGEHRVIEVARQSMIVLAEALVAVGDDFALYGFASDSRLRVRCDRLKAFGEPYDQRVRGGVRALEPADYTRMGAAVRHVGSRLQRRASAQKVMLVITDGRPHDPTDRYEGKYALEDTRRALEELRVCGVHCFGLTIDQRGRDYLPYLFGPGHYAVFSQPQSLPSVLPRLYARITALSA